MVSLLHLPIPSLPSVLFTCLHLISIQNGLTPLEVARANQVDDEVEKKGRLWRRWSKEPKNHSYEDYGRVIDLLGEYSEEPATLPSHDVSIDSLQLAHMTLSATLTLIIYHPE